MSCRAREGAMRQPLESYNREPQKTLSILGSNAAKAVRLYLGVVKE